jgi:4'-phosphopantetheinyl transferase EntD
LARLNPGPIQVKNQCNDEVTRRDFEVMQEMHRAMLIPLKVPHEARRAYSRRMESVAAANASAGALKAVDTPQAPELPT